MRFHHAPEFDRLGLANLVHVANECAKVSTGTREWDDFEASLQPFALDHLRLAMPKMKSCWSDAMHDVDAIESFMWS